MLLSTINPEAAEAIGNIKKIGVGNRVVYHARAGMMRQGRITFPADVLKQHEDGSLDLYVIMEPEEIIMEQRVAFQSHNQANHCWSVVQDVPAAAPLAVYAEDDVMEDDARQPGHIVGAPQSVPLREIEKLHEHIASLNARLDALEVKRGPGRPAKPKAA